MYLKKIWALSLTQSQCHYQTKKKNLTIIPIKSIYRGQFDKSSEWKSGWLILSGYCHKTMIRNLNFPKIITVKVNRGWQRKEL